MHRSILSLLAAAAVGVAAAGCATSTAETKAAKGSSEAAFLTLAAHGSHAELSTSQLALQKATDPAVKQYAQMMVTDHTQQNQTLMALAKSKGMSVPARPDEAHVKMAATLSKLSGKEFDAEYMSMMVADHAKLLSKMQDKAKMAKDPEVQQWASQQVPILQAHLDQARQINQRLGGGSTVGGGSGGGGSGGMGGMNH